MDANVINEEEHESSKVTTEQSESGIPEVVEESKLEYSEPSTLLNITEPSMLPQHYFMPDQKPLSLSDGDYDSKISFEFNVFLYTKYQGELEKASEISNLPADETKPFEFKYQAREILENLFKRHILKFEKSPEFQSKIQNNGGHNLGESLEETKRDDTLQTQSEHDTTKQSSVDRDLINLAIAKGQIVWLLAQNYFESEEYQESENHYQIALKYLNSLPKEDKIRHVNIIQDIYNSLGIIHCNRDNHKKGLPHFAKAEKIYELVTSIDVACPAIKNNLKQFLRSCKASSYSPASDTFGFYIDGGIDKVKVERNYTLTLFYLAQVYTKLKRNEKAVTYCAQTMKRQLETKEYEVKDWATNCVNLAEYFIENNHFSQAEYCLFAGVSILPPTDKNDDDKELRSTMQAQVGQYYLQRLKFGVDMFQKGLTIGTSGPLFDTVHKQFIEFPSLKLKWPEINDITDIEQAKLLFRLGNTQFKKALEYYVLDGYVTNHCKIKKDVSDLYKHIIMMETNKPRIYAMYERRRDLLEPIINEINPEAYEVVWTESVMDLINIFHEMFDHKYEELKEAKKMPKKAQFELLNNYGESAIKYATQLSEKLENMKNIEDKDAYIQAIINQRLAIGKIYSKLYDKDKKVIVEYYAKALENYKLLDRIMRDYKTRNDMTPTLEDQFRLCSEMIDLLPIKINKINNS